MDLLYKFYQEQVNVDKRLKLLIKHTLAALLSFTVDLYTVECSLYVDKLNKLRRFSGKIKYLPNGFFGDILAVNMPKEKIILTVGRIGTYEKNTEMLVEALKLIDKERLAGWQVYLVGEVTDDFKIWYEKEIESKPYLKDFFVLTGHISDRKKLFEIYSKSSVFVLTSRWESWGLVLTEAAHFKNYPIVTDCCDSFREVIMEGINGFGKIIPSEDVTALKEALEEVLENRIDFRHKGNLAGMFVDERFEWKYICNKLNRYFERLGIK